jgi:hypothetical protein
MLEVADRPMMMSMARRERASEPPPPPSTLRTLATGSPPVCWPAPANGRRRRRLPGWSRNELKLELAHPAGEARPLRRAGQFKSAIKESPPPPCLLYVTRPSVGAHCALAHGRRRREDPLSERACARGRAALVCLGGPPNWPYCSRADRSTRGSRLVQAPPRAPRSRCSTPPPPLASRPR